MQKESKESFDEKKILKSIKKFPEEAVLFLYSECENKDKDELLQDEEFMQTLRVNLKKYPLQTKFVLYSPHVKNSERTSLLKNKDAIAKIFEQFRGVDLQITANRLDEQIGEKKQKDVKAIQLAIGMLPFSSTASASLEKFCQSAVLLEESKAKNNSGIKKISNFLNNLNLFSNPKTEKNSEKQRLFNPV